MTMMTANTFLRPVDQALCYLKCVCGWFDSQQPLRWARLLPSFHRKNLIAYDHRVRKQ